ncbi:hypothetical protein FRX31_020289 [Thalictrum thalictroides]|uniref:Uncharacterized protein n=1 Tax=Thalictrum thalictroides TaxID=46969 RepID=A0A7J6VZ36_THATH|nr:hypothetical protein FRX31_020289 [Thalictrum thalictroides]
MALQFVASYADHTQLFVGFNEDQSQLGENLHLFDGESALQVNSVGEDLKFVAQLCGLLVDSIKSYCPTTLASSYKSKLVWLATCDVD